MFLQGAFAGLCQPRSCCRLWGGTTSTGVSFERWKSTWLSFAVATRSKKIEHVQRSSESNRRHMHTKKRRWNHTQNCKMCFVCMFFVAKFYLKPHQHDVQNLKARQLQQQPVAQRLLIRRKDRISNQEYPKKLARVVTLVPMKSRNTP